MERAGKMGERSIQARRRLLAAACAMAAGPTLAIELDFGEVKGAWNTTVTVGTAIRTKDADGCCFGAANGNSIGVPGGQTGGGAGNLNFEQWESFSTVGKVVSDLELKYKNYGLLVRGTAWYDYELEDVDHRYGNHVNLFTRNVPLGDSSLNSLAQFSGAALLDAFVYGNFDIGEQYSLSARAGRQVVSWGEALLIPGGINAINPVDVSALRRPGAQIKEALLPVGLAYGNLGVGKDLSVEAFYQWQWKPTSLEGCGTFFAVTDFIVPGCNGANILGAQGISEYDVFNPNSTKTFPGTTIPTYNAYVHRAASRNPKDGGQYGFALRYLVDAIETEFGLYYINNHSKVPSLDVVLPTDPAVLATPGFPGVIARLKSPNGVKYRSAFQEDVQLLGVSAAGNVMGVAVFGEVSYRHDQPITLNAADLIQAFVNRSPTSALNLAYNTNALPAGSVFRGYDLFDVFTADLGVNKTFPQALGTDSIGLIAEVGYSHVQSLPDPANLRYGRSESYGVAQVGNLPCVDTVPGKTCARDGFVTSNAWGYRLRANFLFQNAFWNVNLTPSIVWTQDVQGWSYDGTFQEGRKTLGLGARGDYLNRYFAEINYVTYLNGGAYNLLADRDYVALSVGMSF